MCADTTGPDEESSDEHLQKIIETVQQMLAGASDGTGISGAMIGPDGTVRLGMPNWEEVTRNQRFAEKVKTHGWPPGLAKSTRWRRDDLVREHEAALTELSEGERAQYQARHEALAWAVDAERFLGSWHALNHFGVDQVTTHLLLWLRERGFQVVPIEDGEFSAN